MQSEIGCKLFDMTMNTLAERALFARKRAGFRSQEAAAKAIGCSRGTIGMWETNGTQRIEEYLHPAARAYKVRPEWLNMEANDDGYPWESASNVVPLVRETAGGYPASQPLQQTPLRIALQLVAEELDGRGLALPIPKRAALTESVYEMLAEGLSEAAIVRFVRAAIS